MTAGHKRNGPRAVAAAREAKNVPLGKRTPLHSALAPIDANAFARAWVARRYRTRTQWAAIIADAAGLGGRP